ncbi:MAG TPA: hypothetical protein VJ278_02295 [Chthoniobacterales bacterium]|jgi:hypothetical protein|nr:hypothetical protein [Chthoniobacterales bacterium]
MTLSTLINDYIIGWSVAWPPGPINAEMAHISAHASWQIGTEAISAAVMVWFAIRLLLHFP